jgi:epoxyqueuosine reductase
MVSAFKQPLTAADIKAKARAVGADLVGIADGATLERHPPDPRDPRRPSDITDLDGGRVIVLAKRVSRGSARIAAWNDRQPGRSSVVCRLKSTAFRPAFSGDPDRSSRR